MTSFDFNRIKSMKNPHEVIFQIYENLKKIKKTSIKWEDGYFTFNYYTFNRNKLKMTVKQIKKDYIIVKINESSIDFGLPLITFSKSVLSKMLCHYIELCEKNLSKNKFDNVFSFLNLQKQ